MKIVIHQYNPPKPHLRNIDLRETPHTSSLFGIEIIVSGYTHQYCWLLIMVSHIGLTILAILIGWILPILVCPWTSWTVSLTMESQPFNQVRNRDTFGDTAQALGLRLLRTN